MSAADEPGRLTVFLAFAQDRVDGARYLRNLPVEQRRIRAALQPAVDAGLCDVVERGNATINDVLDVFQSGARNRIAVFHFGGHAGSGELLLESPEGTPVYAHATGLAQFLGQQRGLALVFLNGCSSQGQVGGLLQAGVAAVVATSEAIRDDVATDFATRFYAGLAAGATLRAAFVQAEGAARVTLGENVRNALREAGPAMMADDSRWPWQLYTVTNEQAATESWSLPAAAHAPLYGLPPLSPGELPQRPFKHLHWFERKDAGVFFGRGSDIRRLYKALTDPVGAPIVLLFGATGVGKSSVLDAGLAPRLEASYDVRYRRHQSDRSLTGTLIDALCASEEESPRQAWHRHEVLGRPLIVMLDQVEEAWTQATDSLNEVAFGTHLRELFNADAMPPNGRLMLSFRKEWLAEVLRLLDKEGLPRTLHELTHLNRAGVIEAISGPCLQEHLRERYHMTVDTGLPELIADELLADVDSTIAPTLQILLTKMWTRAYNISSAAPHFSTAAYRELRRAGLLLSDFIDEQFAALRSAAAQDVDSGLALDLLNYHANSLGSAELRTRADLHARYGDRHGLDELVDRCTHGYLLIEGKQPTSVYPHDTGNAQRTTRLAHDTLAPLIRSRHEVSLRPGQRASRILEQRAREWEDGRIGATLDDFDMTLVDAGASGMRSWSEAEQRLVAASRNSRSRRRWTRLALTVLGGLAVALVALTSIYAWMLTLEARGSQVLSSDRAITAIASTVSDPTQRLLYLLEIDNLDTSPTAQSQLSLALDDGIVEATIDDVVAAWVNPTGDRVLTTSLANALTLWNIKDRKERTQSFPYLGLVYFATFNAMGSQVLTVSVDGGAQLWDTQDVKKPLRVFNGHTARINSAVFNEAGDRVLTASDDKTARLWDINNGTRPILTFAGHELPVSSAIFNAAGDRVLTICDGHIVRLWDINNGETPLKTFSAHIHHVDAQVDSAERTLPPVFDAAGNRVLTFTSSEGRAQIWDIFNDRAPLQTFTHPGVSSVALSRAGDLILTTSTTDNSAYLWDIEGNGQIISGEFRPDSVVFNSAGDRMLLTTYGDFGAGVWDIDELDEPLLTFSQTVSSVGSAVFNAAGDHVLTLSEYTNRAQLWDLSEVGIPLLTYSKSVPDISSAVFSVSGDRVLTAHADNAVRVWDINNSETPLQTVSWTHEQGRLRILTATNDYALTGHDDISLRLWSLHGGGDKPLQTFNVDGPVIYAAFNAAASRILTITEYDDTVQLWDVKDGRHPLQTFTGHKRDVNSAVFNAAGDHVLTASDDRTARLWDVNNGQKPIRTFTGHGGPVVSAIFSPKGDRVIAASSDGDVRLWDINRSNESLQTYSYRKGESASFNTVGDRVLIMHRDDTVGLWKTEFDGTPLHTFRDKLVSLASINAAGDRVLTVSMNGTAKLWAADGTTLQAIGRSRTRTCLDAGSLAKALGEEESRTEARHAACVACLPEYFDVLGSIPESDARRYGKSWSRYKQCVDQQLGKATTN